MPYTPTGGPSGPTGKAGAYLEEIAASVGKPSEAKGARAPQGRAGPTMLDDPDYSEGVGELVRMWVLEDLDVVAEVYQVDPRDLFEDVLVLATSETPAFHQGGADYADGIQQLLDWFLEDVGSVARAFGLDPADAFEDFMRVIISDTPLADRMLDAG